MMKHATEPNALSSGHPTNVPVEASSTHDSAGEDRPFGPLTESEADNLQREANEDTTRSEDLRQFLQEMREKIKEDQAQLQQQLQNAQASGPGGGLVPGVTNQPVYRHSAVEPVIDQFLQQQTQQWVAKPPTTQATRDSVQDLYGQDTAPDGGWSWIVMFSSFCCLILVDGIGLSYGLLMSPQCGYSDFQFFQPLQSNTKSPGKTRERMLRPVLGSCIPVSAMGEEWGTQNRMLLHLPGALLLGCYLFLGPLVSALTNQFDVRPVTMTGAVLSTVALFTSAFAPTLELFAITYGVLGGIGLSLIYLPAIATVGQWFRQRRPLAVGLALCGSGVGCLLGAQGVPRLVHWVTWRGALIIMAAASFQSLVLIAMFRSLDTHTRIRQAQHVKRALNEAARRKSALHRMEVERRMAEIRLRKRLGDSGQKMSQAPNLYPGLRRPPMGDRKVIRIDPKRYTQGMLDTYGMLRGTGNRVRVGAIMTRGGQPVALGQPLIMGRGGDTGRGNVIAGRRMGSYKGSIMQRIIEEKQRQRTTSVGSLDGMVITRDNKLIAAPVGSLIDRPLLSAKTIARLSDSIANKCESKLQHLIPADGTPESRAAFSRSLRESLPHIVQEYIQSQLSTIQHCQLSATPSIAGINAPAFFPNAHAVDIPDRDLPVDGIRLSEAVGSSTPISSAHSSHESTTQLIAPVPTTTRSMNISTCQSECASLRPHASDTSLDSTVQAGGTVVNTTAALGDASASVSMADAAELLLDNQLRAEIHNRLRRELARPQYKKDLFYTGSVRQLSRPDALSVGFATVTKHHSFICPPVYSANASFRLPAQRTSVLGIAQLDSQDFDSDSKQGVILRTPGSVSTRFVHNSQSNISFGPGGGGGGGGTAFVPPAPCPAVPQVQPVPVSVQTLVTTELGDNEGSEPQRPPSTELTTCSHNPSADRVSSTEQDDADADDEALDDQEEMDYDGRSDLDDDDVGDVEDDMVDGLDGASEQTPRCNPCQPLIAFCSPTTGYLNPMFSFIPELLAPAILTRPTFILMLMSTAVTMLGFFVPFLMLPDLLAELDWTLSDSGSALFAVGLSNTVGRLIAAMYIEKDWSSQYRWADCLWLNNGSLLISGIMVLLMPFVRTHYPALIFVCLVFGFCCAVFVSMKSILVVELLGLDRLTNAFGYMLLLQGVASVAGLVIAGYLRDLQIDPLPPGFIIPPNLAPVHNATAVGFYFAGVCLVCGCLLGLPLRWTSRRELPLEATTFKPPPPYIHYDSAEQSSMDGQPDTMGVNVDLHSDHQSASHLLPATDQGYISITTPSHLISQVAPATGAPGAVVDVGTPCVLATVNENIALSINTTDLMIPPGATPSACLDTPMLVIPASGVTLPVVPTAPAVTMTAQIKKSEVMGVQEETGLEPVVEEEEEEEDEDDEEVSAAVATGEIPTTPSGRFEVVSVAEPSAEDQAAQTWKRKKRRKSNRPAPPLGAVTESVERNLGQTGAGDSTTSADACQDTV